MVEFLHLINILTDVPVTLHELLAFIAVWSLFIYNYVQWEPELYLAQP